ncbi:MAG: hypothetical protein JWR12_817 [Mucilaginibacter sp.]|nr:hypothetical protein [Mucilaginibacter sp.]
MEEIVEQIELLVEQLKGQNLMSTKQRTPQKAGFSCNFSLD